jgi:dienelactone hydrolase
MRKFLKWTAIGLLLLVVIGGGAFVAWSLSRVALPAPDALAALASDNRVQVDDGQYLVFRPVSGNLKDPGVIFYPGANCDIRGYAAVLRRIAARGYLVVAVPMPLNQAIFASSRGDDVRQAFPEVKRWAIVGHSMGGAMAAHYAADRPNELAGLVIWDSRPAESDNIVDLGYPVWHIHRATPDGQPPEKFAKYRPAYPADSPWVPIPGGDHMSFGSFIGGGYVEQWQATISEAEQHDLVVTATLNALVAMTAS